MAYLDQFNYQLLGYPAGPKLVFMHGLMGSGANWRKVASSFEEDYHILLFDQRGHGRSFQPIQGYRPEDFSDDLFNILNELHWDKADLVGHSMGGRNALNFAARWPHRVNRLVLEDIGPDANLKAAERIEGYLRFIPTPFTTRAEAKEFLLGKFKANLGGGGRAETLAQFFYSNMAENQQGAVDWRFSKSGILSALSEGRVKERWHEVQSLSCPTLVVRGELSEDLSHEVYVKMLASNPRLLGVEIAGSGHWVHFEKVEAFIQEVKKFLKSGN